MNLFVIFGVIAVLVVLNFSRKVPILAWMFIWPLAVWVMIDYGISVNVPVSVLKIYLWMTVGGAISYIYADNERYDEVVGQLQSFICDAKYSVPLYAVMVLLPAGVAAKIYIDQNVEVRAATFGRTVHPAPPNDLKFKGKTVNLVTGKNPYRPLKESDPDSFAKHVENGKAVYYQNCVYCHGDDMGGDGIFAHAFAPVPANFNTPTTIAMLQESYLFWRIAKGGPGLPEESGPWSSSMPAWEKFLNEEQIWDVILYLYEYTGYEPRAEEEHH